MMHFDSKYVEKKLAPFPLFLKYVGPSLIVRGNCNNWYENRFIFNIYTTLTFVKRFERLLNEVSGDFDLGGIFADLRGAAKDYDLRVFDVFAEIQSVIWAYKNDFTNILKIPPPIPPNKHVIADFTMDDESGKKIVMEVKNIRCSDPFHDLAHDRARGLLLVNGLIKRIGLNIDETDKYLQYQHKILGIRNKNQLAGKLRNQLSNDKIIELANGNISDIDLLNGLLKVKATKYVRVSSMFHSFSKKLEKPVHTLKRLIRDVNDKKTQLNNYIEATSKEFDEGIVFITGIGNDEKSWDLLSDELNNSNSGIWAEVNLVYTNGSQIPIRIITDFGTKYGNYHDFPRNYKEYSKIRKEYESILNNISRY